MAHYLSPKELRLASPQKEIKPKVYQLNEGQTLFLGALARFDYVSGEKQGVVVYLDNNLMIHRTKTENACRKTVESSFRRRDEDISETCQI